MYMYTRTRRHGKWEKRSALDSLRYRSLPSFFSLSTLWAAIHPLPPPRRFLLQPSHYSRLPPWHTHTGYAACPPPFVRPENRGKLNPFGVFRMRQHARISLHITSHYVIPCEQRMCVMRCIHRLQVFITR